MAEIKKNYLTKFPREIIEKAHKAFVGSLDPGYFVQGSDWVVEYGSKVLSLDSESDFFAEYMQEVSNGRLRYNYLSGKGTSIFELYYKLDYYGNANSDIKISLGSREDIEKILYIYDKYYDDFIEENKWIACDSNKPSYSMELQMPSCYISKDLLNELEQYLKDKSKQLKLSDYAVCIQDSVGIEELPSINDFKSSYFSNDTTKIALQYGKNINKLSLEFDIMKKYSKLKISLHNESARALADGIAAEIGRILDNHRTKNHLFHYLDSQDGLQLFALAAAISGILAIGASITSIMDIPINISFNTAKVLMLGSSVFAFIIYITFSRLTPYTTFKTIKNERTNWWSNWFAFKVVEFIIFTIFLGGVAKHFGVI